MKKITVLEWFLSRTLSFIFLFCLLWCPLSGLCLRRGLRKAGFSLLAALQFLKFMNSLCITGAVWKLQLVLQGWRLCPRYSKDSWYEATNSSCQKILAEICIGMCACISTSLCVYTCIKLLPYQWGNPQPCALVYFLCCWEVLAGLTALGMGDLRLSIA